MANDILNKDFSNILETVNDAVHHVNSILTKAVSMSFKLSHSKNKKTKTDMCNKRMVRP